MTCFYASDINKRKENQDSYCHMELRMNHEAAVSGMAVADGMGGMAGGKYFSELAVRLWFQHLQQMIMSDDFRGQTLMQQQQRLERFNKEVYGSLAFTLYKKGLDEGYRGGTTLSAAIMFWDTFYLSNCGDSPIYIVRDGKIRLLSEIQNVAGIMVQQGRTTMKSRLYYQNKNLLVQYLGGKEVPQPWTAAIPVSEVDYLLMGSDGAFGDLLPEEIGRIMTGAERPQDIIPDLFARTREEGEDDNQTAILYVRDELGRQGLTDVGLANIRYESEKISNESLFKKVRNKLLGE